MSSIPLKIKEIFYSSLSEKTLSGRMFELYKGAFGTHTSHHRNSMREAKVKWETKQCCPRNGRVFNEPELSLL